MVTGAGATPSAAGHNYPTGTTRRALHLYKQLDDEPERLTATLADTPPDVEDSSITGPTLAPGEVRKINLPGRSTHVRARLVYARNRFQPDAYSVEATAIEWPSTAGEIE